MPFSDLLLIYTTGDVHMESGVSKGAVCTPEHAQLVGRVRELGTCTWEDRLCLQMAPCCVCMDDALFSGVLPVHGGTFTQLLNSCILFPGRYSHCLLSTPVPVWHSSVFWLGQSWPLSPAILFLKAEGSILFLYVQKTGTEAQGSGVFRRIEDLK